jgi:hypothetical protein
VTSLEAVSGLLFGNVVDAVEAGTCFTNRKSLIPLIFIVWHGEKVIVKGLENWVSHRRIDHTAFQQLEAGNRSTRRSLSSELSCQPDCKESGKRCPALDPRCPINTWTEIALALKFEASWGSSDVEESNECWVKSCGKPQFTTLFKQCRSARVSDASALLRDETQACQATRISTNWRAPITRVGRSLDGSKTSHRHKLEKSLVWSQCYVRKIAHHKNLF